MMKMGKKLLTFYTGAFTLTALRSWKREQKQFRDSEHSHRGIFGYYK